MAQFLLMLVMIVSALLLSALSVSAASDSEKAVGAPGGAARAAASSYPKLTNTSTIPARAFGNNASVRLSPAIARAGEA